MATKTVAKTVVLKKTQLSFPKLFKPEAYAEGEPRFSTTVLMEPGGEAAVALQTAMEELIKEQWGKKPNGLEVCLKDGDQKVASARNPENYGMYGGRVYVTASCKRDAPPVVVDADARTPLTAASGKIYGGVLADVIVRLWGQDNKWGLRVNCELKGVQYRGKGTPFGGGMVDPTALFDEIVEEEEWA
jgi:hypothetical protein